MVSQSYLIRLAAICAVVNAAPLPLNINLGAYSPALVVGDGAIGFEGAAAGGVESIINTLQGAAASGAARAAAVAPAAEAVVQQPATGLGLGAKAVSSGILSEKATLPVPGSAPLGPRSEDVQDDVEIEEEVDESASAPIQKRQNAGFQAALNFAEGALTKGPKVQLGTGAHGSGIGIIVENGPRAAAAE